MATVYLAEDLKLHPRVAIKLLHPELGATLGPERFRREIAIAARFTHPQQAVRTGRLVPTTLSIARKP
jgi:serine/threonine-protein kinase